MKKYINTAVKHPLIAGSAIILLGTTIGNIFHFLYNLFMSRNLAVEDYGILASLNSLITLPLLTGSAVAPIIVNFAASFFASNEIGMLRSMYFRFTKVLFVGNFLFLLIYFLLSPAIAQFFHIKNIFVIFVGGIIIFLSFSNIINGAFTQAKLAFGYISFLNFIGAFTKLSLGALLVILGLSVNGAMMALLSSALIVYLLSFIPLRFLFQSGSYKTERVKLRSFISYGLPAAVAIFSLTSLISIDLFMVKHFYSPHDAGIYAGISLIGKVIFFFTSPILTVMFPLIAQKHARKEEYRSTFLLALLFVLLSACALILFYYLFPEFAIKFFLKREEYLAGSPILLPIAILISLYSLLNVVANFFLSIKKAVICIPLIMAVMLQIILLWLFHQNFFQIIFISTGIVCLLLLGLLLYYWKSYARESKTP